MDLLQWLWLENGLGVRHSLRDKFFIGEGLRDELRVSHDCIDREDESLGNSLRY